MDYNKVHEGDTFEPSAKLTNDTIDLLTRMNKNGSLNYTNKPKNYNLISGVATENIQAESFVCSTKLVEYQENYYASFSTKIEEKTNLFYVKSDKEEGDVFNAIASGVVLCKKSTYEAVKDLANNLSLLIDGDDMVVVQLIAAPPISDGILTTPFYVQRISETGLSISLGFFNVNGVFQTVKSSTIKINTGYLCLNVGIKDGKFTNPTYQYTEPDVNNYPIAYIANDGTITQFRVTVAVFMLAKQCPMAKLSN